MKISELIELDLRDKANKIYLDEKLHTLPPFKHLSDDEPITIEAMEKFATQIKKNTDFMLTSICLNAGWNQKPGYHIGYIFDNARPGNDKVIYGLDLWEIYAKSVIYMFARHKKRKGGS